MDEKTKLYVFSKKEVALIFLFMIVSAVTSFVVGVKIGKSFSYSASGLQKEDRKMVDILSGQEEMVNEVVDKRNQDPDQNNAGLDDLNQRLEERLVEELSDKAPSGSMGTNDEEVLEKKKTEINKSESAEDLGTDRQNRVKEQENSQVKVKPKNDQFSGKYTIQLGSHRSLKEASDFAEGFKVRGYEPIINETELPDSGTWFRVSLGAFDTLAEAKVYVQKEYSLFQGQDYIFRRFD